MADLATSCAFGAQLQQIYMDFRPLAGELEGGLVLSNGLPEALP